MPETPVAGKRTAVEPSAPGPRLYELINASWTTQALYAAVALRIPEALAGGPQSADSLARATGCHPASLRRLLRGLVSLEVCREDEDGAFTLSPIGDLLRADVPGSLRDWAIHSGRYLWPAWGGLEDSVRTGASDRKRAIGVDDYGHLERDREAAAVFNRAMVGVTRLVAREVVRVLDFAGVACIVDVGGGYGGLLAELLAAHPGMRGVLLDLPHAVDAARPQLAVAGVAARCELVAGSFFESVPAGADAYALKSVLHNWDDHRSAEILRNCRRAAHGRSRLLVVERVMADRVSSAPRDQAIARADLNMLVARGGRERTEAEFRALFESTGFRIDRIVPVALEFSVIEASPGPA